MQDKTRQDKTRQDKTRQDKWHISTHLFTNITGGTGERKGPAGETHETVLEAESVDECLWVMPRAVWEKVPFTDIAGWHLYAVEQCLRCKRAGFTNYIIPVSGVWHVSDGDSMGADYVVILKQMAPEYKADYRYIDTTMGRWYTDKIHLWLYSTKWQLKKIKTLYFMYKKLKRALRR